MYPRPTRFQPRSWPGACWRCCAIPPSSSSTARWRTTSPMPVRCVIGNWRTKWADCLSNTWFFDPIGLTVGSAMALMSGRVRCGSVSSASEIRATGSSCATNCSAHYTRTHQLLAVFPSGFPCLRLPVCRGHCSNCSRAWQSTSMYTFITLTSAVVSGLILSATANGLA